jgi:predicted esterase
MQGIEGIMQAPGLGFPAALAAITLVLSATLAPARAEIMRLLTNQGDREAIVLPSRQGPAPTILVLHGALSTASYAAEKSGFGEVAAEHGFTAVFPQGIRKQWNDGREVQTAGVDDVSFLHRLVTALVGRGITDPRQVYIAGISNGGMMTFRMLCEASELFAGAATVIANMPARIGARCAPRKPLPVVMFNGTADPVAALVFWAGVARYGPPRKPPSSWPTSTPAPLRAPCRYRAHGMDVYRRPGSNGRPAGAAAPWRFIVSTVAAIRSPATANSCRCSWAAAPARCMLQMKPSPFSGAEYQRGGA